MSGQRVDGLFGAMIVKENPGKANPGKTNEPEDLIMTVGDWYHDKGAEVRSKQVN